MLIFTITISVIMSALLTVQQIRIDFYRTKYSRSKKRIESLKQACQELNGKIKRLDVMLTESMKESDKKEFAEVLTRFNKQWQFEGLHITDSALYSADTADSATKRYNGGYNNVTHCREYHAITIPGSSQENYRNLRKGQYFHPKSRPAIPGQQDHG